MFYFPAFSLFCFFSLGLAFFFVLPRLASAGAVHRRAGLDGATTAVLPWEPSTAGLLQRPDVDIAGQHRRCCLRHPSAPAQRACLDTQIAPHRLCKRFSLRKAEQTSFSLSLGQGEQEALSKLTTSSTRPFGSLTCCLFVSVPCRHPSSSAYGACATNLNPAQSRQTAKVYIRTLLITFPQEGNTCSSPESHLSVNSPIALPETSVCPAVNNPSTCSLSLHTFHPPFEHILRSLHNHPLLLFHPAFKQYIG